LVFGVFSVFLLLFDKKSFKAGICDAAKACNNNSIDAKRKNPGVYTFIITQQTDNATDNQTSRRQRHQK